MYCNMHALVSVLPKRLAMMLVTVEAGHTVLPKRLAMMLVRVEAGHMVLPERLTMMLVRVETGHTVLPERLGHISYLKAKIKTPLVQNSSFSSFCMHIQKFLCEMLPRAINITYYLNLFFLLSV